MTTRARISVAVACLVVALAPARAGANDPSDAQLSNLSRVVPPRTVGDVTGVLNEYKPDPGRAAAAKAAADQPPPAGQSDAELAEFYLRRALAANQVGRPVQQLADARQAVAYAEKAGVERGKFVQQLMTAEAANSNFANAIRYGEEDAEIDDKRGARPRLFVTYRLLVHYNVMRANLPEAARWVEKLQALYAESQGWGAGQGAHGGPPGGGRGGGEGIQGARRGGRGAPRPSTEAAPAPTPPAERPDRFAALRPAWRANVGSAEAELAEARGQWRQMDTTLQGAIEQYEQFLRNVAGRPPGDLPPELRQYLRDDMIMRRSFALQMQGKLVESEVEARRALVNALKSVGRYNGITTARLARLSYVTLEQGRAREAEQLARANIAIFEAIDASRSWGLANARNALGGTLVAQGRWADALAAYDAMMKGLAGDEIGTRKFGFGHLDWATALIKTGRLEPAAAMINRSHERQRKTMGEQSYGAQLSRGFQGWVLAAQGQRGPALQAFRAAIPGLLATASRADDDSPTAKARRIHLVLDAYIRLLDEIRGTPIEASAKLDAAAEAFRIADAARGQSVQRALSEASARVNLRDPALADLARREQDTGQALTGLEGTLVNAVAAPADQQDAHAIDVLRDQIAQLRTSRDGLRQEIARRFPDYAALTSPKPATLEATRAALRPGEALVAAYVSDDVTFVWAVPQQGPVAFAKTTVSAAQLAAAVKQLRGALDPQARTLADIPAFDVTLAHELYAKLLKPVESGWGGAKSLLVVPDRALAELPLGLLVTQPVGAPVEAKGQPAFAGYKSVPFLVRQVAITQLPSVAALSTLRALPPAPGNRAPFVGYGDPLFNPQQAAERVAVADAGGLTTRGAKLVLRSAPKTAQAASANLGMLPRLPETADEMRAIARALRADPDKDVFVGAAANERAVETANLANRRVIAFATHGLVPGDLDGLTQPALALSAPQVAHVDGDGLLTMDEVLALKLNADWVVLSACNTAAGDGAGAEAVSGLGRAFFYAGARALLVSNWPVETVSARALTTDLFKRQAADPALARAEALRQAELALIDGAGGPGFSYAHPIFWAPFSLVGDGGGS